MNTMQHTPRQATVLPFRYPSDSHTAARPKTPVAVFSSFMGGYHVLDELLLGELADRVHCPLDSIVRSFPEMRISLSVQTSMIRPSPPKYTKMYGVSLRIETLTGFFSSSLRMRYTPNK